MKSISVEADFHFAQVIDDGCNLCTRFQRASNQWQILNLQARQALMEGIGSPASLDEAEAMQILIKYCTSCAELPEEERLANGIMRFSCGWRG